ncbi:hypothetical protein diail_2006, partial [Diaporthe ilicicola]
LTPLPSLYCPSPIIAEYLRKNLAKAQVEKQRTAEKKQLLADQDSKSPLENPENWKQARALIAKGIKAPERRFHIIISPKSLVSTPQKLQELAKMESAPKLIDTTYTGLHRGKPKAPQMQQNGKPQKVRVSEVSYRAWLEITDKMDCEIDLCVWIDKKFSGATFVKSFRKPATK